MNMPLVIVALDVMVMLLLFVSLVFAVGIVWRVEKELDVSYKFFVGALVFLLLSEFVGKIFSETIFFTILSAIFKVIFAGLLLAGIWTMRDLIRRLDGEK
ncbi:MAG: hypothetical protein IPK84_02345 [Candidatus Moraniibacteriota bacterium]|nr:MAG: hypothetical protein IPK84_02345 [Candidatus Moranbacteria bacterium]